MNHHDAELTKESQRRAVGIREARGTHTPTPESAANPDKPRRSGARVRARVDRRVVDWGPAYLEALLNNGCVSAAAKVAGVCRHTVWERRKSDSKFREAEEAAREQAADLLQDEAWRRAVEGVVKFKFGPDGKPLMDPRTGEPYYELEYSDKLLLALLRANKPERYRDGCSVPGKQARHV